MNFDRIESSVAVADMSRRRVVLVGGAKRLLLNLARCGLGEATSIDFGIVRDANIPRQDHTHEDLGRRKAEVMAEEFAAINPDGTVYVIARDVCSLNDEEIRRICGGAHLLIAAADTFPAQARCNQIALELGIPLLAMGLYAQGQGGEVIYRIPGVTRACYRCIAAARYAAFHRGGASISSHGGTIFDLDLLDAIAGQVALGILTRGADNRFGKLIDRLAGRNVLVTRTDPDLRFGDRDLFAERLGNDPANFSFSTVALRRDADPQCPDCGHRQVEEAA